MIRFIDANIFLRLLLWDDPPKAVACRKLFEKSLEHNEPLWTTSLVIAEIIWVLEKTYQYPRTKIADAVLKILATENIQINEKGLLMESVALYKIKNIDFIDAFNATTMLESGIRTIYSYDTDFDGIHSIHRLEP